jgi:hypothetical protein
MKQILTPEQSARYAEWMHKNQERLRRCGVEEEITLLAGLGLTGATTPSAATPGGAAGAGAGGASATAGGANSAASATAAVSDPKLRAACEILKKPDAELTLADVDVLLAISQAT